MEEQNEPLSREQLAEHPEMILNKVCSVGRSWGKKEIFIAGLISEWDSKTGKYTFTYHNKKQDRLIVQHISLKHITRLSPLPEEAQIIWKLKNK